MPGTLTSGGNILYAWLIAPTLTPVAVAANTTAEQAFTIQGLLPNDMVSGYSYGSAQTAGLGIVNMRVSAANTLQIGFSNSTAGSLTPVSGVYYLCLCRPEMPVALLPTTAA
jgi:hypothetical protein